MSQNLDDTICAYFVNNARSETQTENDIAIAEQFAKALKLMQKQPEDTQIFEIQPIEGFPLIAGGRLSKKDVFVLAHFEGDLFEQLQRTKALVLGPPCIVACLEKCEPIPLGSTPVYTTAMRELRISASGLSSKDRDELKKLIHWMGGHYFQNFGRNITHLISNTIKTKKYEHATLNGVPVMHADWVQCVWQCSQSASSNHISAIEPQFDKYRLPTFYAANITCSGLEASRKDAVMRLVNENGGIYHRAFRSQQVDIVITEQSNTDSEKYKAALRFKKYTLLPEWIFDSQERGYALPTKPYEVLPGKQVSTPTQRFESLTLADQADELSDLSRIGLAAGHRMWSDRKTVSETPAGSSCANSSSRIYNVPVQQQLLLPHGDGRKDTEDAALHHSFNQPKVPIKRKLFEEQKQSEPDLHTYYSQELEPAMPLPVASSTQLSAAAAAPSARSATDNLPNLSISTPSINFDQLDYLRDTTIYVHEACFTSEFYHQLISECKAAQGSLVSPNYTGRVDYIIVSFELVLDELVLPVQARHVVTELYLESCMKQNKLLPLEYFHRPVAFNANKQPLRGMTIVVSVYAGLEREFLNALAEHLGAKLNKALVKRERPLLVAASAEGSKYGGAIKWGFPVVNSAWLLQCAQLGEKLPYDFFLVGNSVNDFSSCSNLKENNGNKTIYSKPATPPAEDKEQQPKDLEEPSPLEEPSSPEELEELSSPEELGDLSSPQEKLGDPSSTQEWEDLSPELASSRSRRISELVTGLPSTRCHCFGSSSTTPESPNSPLNHSINPADAYNFTFLEQVVQSLDTSQARDSLLHIIREIRENPTPELERIKRQAYTPQTNCPAPSIPNFCLTPAFQQRMDDDLERRWRLPKQPIRPETPLAEIRKRVLRITCEKLGVDYYTDAYGKESSDSEEELEQSDPVSTHSNSSSLSGTSFVSMQSPSAANAAATHPLKDLPSGSAINFDKICFEESSSENLLELA